MSIPPKAEPLNNTSTDLELKEIQHPLRDYQFTDEELRVLEECDTESFYERCLPFGAILGGGTYMAVKRGVWKPSPIFGAGPKMCIAFVVGYALGKISYKRTCEEKFMELPNSQVAKILNERDAIRRLPPPDPKKR